MKPNPTVTPKPSVKHNHRSCVTVGKYHYHATADDYRYNRSSETEKRTSASPGRSSTLVKG